MSAGAATAYATHPAADLMPMLGESDLAALAADIRANGLHEPVVLFDGQVLDGRNRLAACRLAGVEPTFRTLESCGDPVSFVLSVNVRRRHLSTTQLAMVGGRVALSLEESGANLHRRSRDAAAEMVGGVESRSVADAISVLKHCIPELIALVDRNDLAVSVAARAAKLPRDQQRELVARGPEAVREAVKAEVKPREGKAPAPPSDAATPAPSSTTSAPAAPAAGVGEFPQHPAPTPLGNLPSHPTIDAIASAPTRDALDAAYTAANSAGLSGHDAEEAGKVYQRRLSEMRESAALVAGFESAIGIMVYAEHERVMDLIITAQRDGKIGHDQWKALDTAWWKKLGELKGERVAQDIDLTGEDADLGNVQRLIDEEAARRRSAREQAPAPTPAASTDAQGHLFTQAATPKPETAAADAAEVSTLRAEVESLRAELAGLRRWSDEIASRAGAADEGSVKKAMRLIALAGSDNENEARSAAYQACRVIREKGLLVATTFSPDLAGDTTNLDELRRSNATRWAKIWRDLENMSRGVQS